NRASGDTHPLQEHLHPCTSVTGDSQGSTRIDVFSTPRVHVYGVCESDGASSGHHHHFSVVRVLVDSATTFTYPTGCLEQRVVRYRGQGDCPRTACSKTIHRNQVIRRQ